MCQNVGKYSLLYCPHFMTISFSYFWFWENNLIQILITLQSLWTWHFNMFPLPFEPGFWLNFLHLQLSWHSLSYLSYSFKAHWAKSVKHNPQNTYIKEFTKFIARELMSKYTAFPINIQQRFIGWFLS